LTRKFRQERRKNMKKAKSKKKAQSKKKAPKKKRAQVTRKAQVAKKKTRGAKKTQSAKKGRGGKKVGGTYPPIVFCNGGTVASIDGAITFQNNFATACTITSCTVPCWPYPPPDPGPVVPAGQQLTIPLRCLPAPGSYNYTASCCPELTPPTIVIV
jgi:hypothetical protein